MRRLFPGVAVVAWLLTGACASDDDGSAVLPRGVDRRGHDNAQERAVKMADPLASATDDRRELLTRSARPPTFVTDTEENPSAEPPAQRDLGAEVQGLLGDPASCINRAGSEGLPAEVRIRIEAHVTETGIVTRAQVSGPPVPQAALECLQARLGFARLRAPIPDAPRTVTTQLTLRRRTPEGTAEAGAAQAAP